MSSDRRRGRGGGRGGVRSDVDGGEGERRSKKPVIDSDDPVQKMFGEISLYLDSRHDKREKLVKLSRDVTIESKRIIFCLHRIKTEEDRAEVLEEAERRLEELKENVWRKVAEELRSEDDYQFIRAYSPGLQEWVEALSFYHFLRHEKILSHQETEAQLRFSSETECPQSPCLRVTVPQSEYVLGLADLTGELMRNAINALGSGDLEVCFTLLEILQTMAEGFGRLPKQETPREFGQKLYTLKQSCRKVENACYAIAVRGSEIPKNRWADLFSKKEEERLQEDFFN